MQRLNLAFNKVRKIKNQLIFKIKNLVTFSKKLKKSAKLFFLRRFIHFPGVQLTTGVLYFMYLPDRFKFGYKTNGKYSVKTLKPMQSKNYSLIFTKNIKKVETQNE